MSERMERLLEVLVEEVRCLRREQTDLLKRLGPRQPQTEPDKVYFILDEATHLVKVGIASDPFARMRQLRTAGGRLRLIGWYPGDRDEERRVHEHLRPYRVRKEWFSYEAGVISFIELMVDPVMLSNMALVPQ